MSRKKCQTLNKFQSNIWHYLVFSEYMCKLKIYKFIPLLFDERPIDDKFHIFVMAELCPDHSA